MKLLTKNDPPPYRIENPDGKAHAIILCDHAGKAVPSGLGSLGLPQEEFEKHPSYDIGAETVARRFAELLDAPAIYSTYSRLVVDVGRMPVRAFPTTAEGVPVTANIEMSDEERQQRIDEIYMPYDNAVNDLVDSYLARGINPVLIAVHSYTPMFFGEQRPWHVAAFWRQDDRLARHAINHFESQGYCVGDNAPYDMRILYGTTVIRHGDSRRLPNVFMELRNDMIDTEEKAREWGEKYYECFKPALDNPETYALYDGPENPYDPIAEDEYFRRIMRTMAA